LLGVEGIDGRHAEHLRAVVVEQTDDLSLDRGNVGVATT
jgi:hypothetical protein